MARSSTRNAASRRRLSRCERYRPAIASFSAAISAGPASVTEPASPSAEPRTAVHLAPRQRKPLSLVRRFRGPLVEPPFARSSCWRDDIAAGNSATNWPGQQGDPRGEDGLVYYRRSGQPDLVEPGVVEGLFMCAAPPRECPDRGNRQRARHAEVGGCGG